MERAKVKNEIVLMRNIVKRVKVQVIRQMTRQVKKLRAKKGTEQQVEKNTRRVERLLAELESIKDLVADDVSRQAFFGKLTFDIKSQEDDTVKRATSRIVQHKIIQERVESLREQGVLSSNINLKELDKKKRRKKKPTHVDLKSEKTGDSKDVNENDKDDDVKDDNNANDENDDNGNSDDNDDSSSDDSNSGEDSDINEDEDNKDVELSKRHQGSPSKIETQDSVEKTPVSDFFMRGSSDDDDSDVEKSDKDLDTDVRPKESKASKKKLMENKKKSKTEEKGPDKLKGMRGRREQLEENTRTAFKKRAADAKAALVDRPNITGTPTDTEKNILGISDIPPGLEFSNKEKSSDGSATGTKRPFPSSAHTSGPRRTASNKKLPKDLSCEKLHPSWEAKRKQKEQTTKFLPFQGTKITFDD